MIENAEVHTLRDGIHAVLNDPAWRLRMAADGPTRAATYDWRIVTRRYLDLIVPLAAARPAA